MRFVIYKNSVLATFCSMFGAAFIAMAVMSMISGELGILPGIGVIAVGLGFMWLGDFISTKKAERKRKRRGRLLPPMPRLLRQAMCRNSRPPVGRILLPLPQPMGRLLFPPRRAGL